MAMHKICVIQVAALGHELVQRHAAQFAPLGLTFHPLQPVFPAVTCTAQATLRTGLDTAGHGVIANGVYSRDLRKVDFWNQSAHLLPAGRIWDAFRAGGGRVGTICCQQSLGDAVDLVLSPAPIHRHHGGMIQDCYSQPPGLYADLCRRLGRRFNLFRYWGPTAGLASSRWIAEATVELLRSPQNCPELLLTYLPHLDYVLQKRGPAPSPELARAVDELVGELGKVVTAARAAGYGLVVWGDYAITPATQVVYPNRQLREAGWLRLRQVRRMTYPDLFASRAVAMVDHQVAHVYVPSPADLEAVRDRLAALPGVAEVLPHAALDHPRAGELILVAEAGAWFAYPWWEDDRLAPDYATHVDIHNKIGFDPAELFWGKLLPPGISLDAGKVKGTHGRHDLPAAAALELPTPTNPPATQIELATTLRATLAH